ncbi:MAG: hypothetical protein V9H26_20910 [Verrucomicrobiota bacterium]
MLQTDLLEGDLLKTGYLREGGGVVAELKIQSVGVDEARIGVGYETVGYVPVASLHSAALHDQVGAGVIAARRAGKFHEAFQFGIAIGVQAVG